MSLGGFQPGAGANPYFWTQDVDANCHRLLELREITGCEGNLRIDSNVHVTGDFSFEGNIIVIGDLEMDCHRILNLREITGCFDNLSFRANTTTHGNINLDSGPGPSDREYQMNGKRFLYSTHPGNLLHLEVYRARVFECIYLGEPDPIALCKGPNDELLVDGRAVAPHSPDRAVQFNNNGSFGGSANLVWTANNRLGILTDAPAYPLDVTGNARVTGIQYVGTASNLLLYTAGPNSATVLAAGDGTGTFNISGNGFVNLFAGLDFTFSPGGTTASALSVRRDGTVVIGAATIPTPFALDVFGDINIQDPDDANGFTYRINGVPFITRPAAPVGAVQFNDAGAFGGSQYLTWDNANRKLIAIAPAVDWMTLILAGGVGYPSVGIGSRYVNSGYKLAFGCQIDPVAGPAQMVLTEKGFLAIGLEDCETPLWVRRAAGADPAFGSADTAIATFDAYAYNALQLGVSLANTVWMQILNPGASIAGPMALNPLGGNVGVGTLTPQAALDVNGNLIISDGTNTGAPSLTLGSYAPISFRLYDSELVITGAYAPTASASAIWMQARGVGDVATPIAINARGGSILIGNDVAFNYSTQLLVFGVVSPPTLVFTDPRIVDFRSNQWNSLSVTWNGTSFSLQAAYDNVYDSAGTRVLPLAINPLGGNVGIGTLNPQFPLDVNGTNIASSLVVRSDWAGIDTISVRSTNPAGAAGISLVNNAIENFNLSLRGVSFGSNPSAVVFTSFGAFPFVFFTGGAERMRILTTGGVSMPGIPTTAPATPNTIWNNGGVLNITPP
jgi:hypothetical protein